MAGSFLVASCRPRSSTCGARKAHRVRAGAILTPSCSSAGPRETAGLKPKTSSLCRHRTSVNCLTMTISYLDTVSTAVHPPSQLCEEVNMRLGLWFLLGLLAPVVVMTDAAIVPVQAQTSIESNAATPTIRQPRVRRRLRTRPVASAPARNEGPTSTAGGRSSDLGNANSGLPGNPGAPSAGASGSTGGH